MLKVSYFREVDPKFRKKIRISLLLGMFLGDIYWTFFSTIIPMKYLWKYLLQIEFDTDMFNKTVTKANFIQNLRHNHKLTFLLLIYIFKHVCVIFVWLCLILLRIWLQLSCEFNVWNVKCLGRNASSMATVAPSHAHAHTVFCV